MQQVYDNSVLNIRETQIIFTDKFLSIMMCLRNHPPPFSSSTSFYHFLFLPPLLFPILISLTRQNYLYKRSTQIFRIAFIANNNHWALNPFTLSQVIQLPHSWPIILSSVGYLVNSYLRSKHPAPILINPIYIHFQVCSSKDPWLQQLSY